MTLVQDPVPDAGDVRSELPTLPDAGELRPEEDVRSDDSVEFRLDAGERYGWWVDHDMGDAREVAMVHGAVNNHRTPVLLDTGASVSILSFDFARKLGLKLRSSKVMKVSGLGGVPTYITAHAEVKITLGPRVVYVIRIWVANIGEGIDVLLGMNFMYAAGIRLCVREGLVQLPDEETILLCGGPDKISYLNLPVTPMQSLYLGPGREAVVRIQYGQSNPQREVVWAGRGDRWVTKIVYASRSWPVAVKVVNISDRDLWIDTRTPVARIVEYGSYPSGRFVRPGSRRYEEWQHLIYENTLSKRTQAQVDQLEMEGREPEPPRVERRAYRWPTQILSRPIEVTAQVRMARLKAAVDGPVMVDASTQTSSAEDQESQDVPDASDLRSVVGGLVDVNPDLEEGYDDEIFYDAVGDPNTDDVPSADDVLNADYVLSTEQTLEPDDVLDTPDDPDAFDLPTTAMPSTPLKKLEEEYARCMRVTAEELELEPAVYLREGSDLMAQLRDELAMLPELEQLNPRCDIDAADVGEPGVSTPEMEAKLRRVLEKHHSIFLGDGNAAPAPARGVVCDLDVGDAKPVAQRARQIAPHLLVKVYELLKKLLETGLIEFSESPWASPIVIVLKKNGVDIRMCIDYRVVNKFIKLSSYPLPLIDDLLIGFERAMWFMSLDMASGFWAILMTQRAKLISAFICPFGHFQWIRMPFGLKNAPLIYQCVINNCLWGFVRLPPEEEAKVDPEVLEFLHLDALSCVGNLGTSSCAGNLDAASCVGMNTNIPALTEEMTVFHRNIPAPGQMGPVLGRSSYIDDIAHGASSWDQLCDDLDALLFRLRYWSISVSLPKSEFGKKTIPYLSHEISAEGIRAMPKIAKSVQDLPFPTTLKGVQSFLGSLNYYNKFVEDLPVVAAVLYELTDEQVRSRRSLERAEQAFEILKRKIVSTPLLRHPDRTKQFVIIPHANPWAAAAVLGQEYDGIIQPVRFTGRVLNEYEVRYHIAEKEVLAILRVLELFRPLLTGNGFPILSTQVVVRIELSGRTMFEVGTRVIPMVIGSASGSTR